MRPIILGLLLITSCLMAQAQELINWAGQSGTVVERTVQINPAWTGTVTATAYYSQGGAPLGAPLQPSVSKVGDVAYVKFSSTLNMAARTYIIISTGSTPRYAGFLTLSEGTLTNTNPNVTGTISASQVVGLAATLSTKKDVRTYEVERNALIDLISQRALSSSVADLARRVARKVDTYEVNTIAEARALAVIGQPADFIIKAHPPYGLTRAFFNGTKFFISPLIELPGQ